MRRLCEKYAKHRPRLVVLFGSRARGDHLETSDIDVLVVADSLPRDPREAFEKLYDPSDPLVMPVGMNTSVFLRKLEEGNTFILEVLEDGKILCGDREFIEEVMRIYREKRRQYIRRGKAWIRLARQSNR